MTLPSAVEVATLAGQFHALRAASQTAQVNTDTQREELSALYAEAQTAAVDLCDTVEFYYRKDPDASSRRTKSARWGVVYFYEPSETPPAPPAGEGTPPAP